MDKIRLGHGSGGKMMHELIAEHFGPAFGMQGFGDSAILDMDPGRLAFTTDSYVVSPLFFPGGNIGELAVYGTVNDLSMAGADPLYLSSGFIIEEGFPFSDLKAIVSSMAVAASNAGVRIVAGDTKVVNRGKGDGIFINTSGVGVVIDIDISPGRIRRGDKVIISGEIGNHGMAVIAERNGITFDPPVMSDTRPLNGLVKSMVGMAAKEIHFMRDPTRGGLATTLKEAAKESGKCIRIREGVLPVPRQVKGACDLLGFDPLYVANEGILVAIVDAGVADSLLSRMRKHPFGTNARIIGEVEESPSGMVLLETSIGGTRILEMLQGEQLPRIC